MRLAFLSSHSPAAQADGAALAQRYGHCDPADADIVVALGGDGFLLDTLHGLGPHAPPVFGINRGTVGFLMNPHTTTDDLPARLAAAQPQTIHPLKATITDTHGQPHTLCAFNEVSLLRQGPQAANLRVGVDGTTHLDNLMCDGVLLATPMGSTAYNLSAHGPILPIGANVLALTPLAAFRPRRWRGAVVPNTAQVSIETLDPTKRPVLASADSASVANVASVAMGLCLEQAYTLLFDPGQDLARRVLAEQFV